MPNNKQAGTNKSEHLKKLSKEQNETEENLLMNNTNLHKTVNKSMSEFIQKANEATLIVSSLPAKPENKSNCVNLNADRFLCPNEVKTL